jgi:hypothetical protein
VFLKLYSFAGLSYGGNVLHGDAMDVDDPGMMGMMGRDGQENAKGKGRK